MRHLLASLGLFVATTLGCGGRPPDTYYYRLVVLQSRAPPRIPTHTVVVVEPFSVDAAYQTERIAYRTSPYRIGYYEYHRWSAPPSLHVRDYMREGLARSGRFLRVIGESTPEATAILRGRVVALEEVDETREHWFGRIELELAVIDANTERVSWSRHVEERELLPTRNPEGLARAISLALDRILNDNLDAIARAAAALEGPKPPAPPVETHVRERRAPKLRTAGAQQP